MKYFLIPFFIFLFTCSSLWAQQDQESAYHLPPFDSLLHKGHAANWTSMEKLSNTVLYMDSVQAIAILDSLKQYAIRYNDKSLALEAEHLIAVYYYCQYNTQGIAGSIQRNMLRFEAILDRAKKERNIPMELHAYYWLGFSAHNNLKNYELSLDYYRLMRSTLQKVSQEECPYKAYFMLIVANTYLEFSDYDRAIETYTEILDYSVTIDSENFIISAKNSLGLCYRYKQMPDSADYWFRRVLASTDASRYPEWEGIVSSNLGVNLLAAGDTVAATPLFTLALQRAQEYNDIGMVISNSLYLADISISRRQLPEAKQYLNTASQHITQHGSSRKIGAYYRITGKYYTLMGDKQRAIAFQDSAYTTQSKYNEEFNAVLLLRMEQKDQMQQQRLKNEELRLKQMQLRVIVAGLLLLGVFLVIYIYLYHKKKVAYRALALRVQQWAEVVTQHQPLFLSPAEPVDIDCEALSDELHVEENTPQADAATLALFNKLQCLLSEEHWYRQHDITLDSTAAKLGVRRHGLSQAINLCAGNNFNTYINEYRVKEAVRIISQDRAGKLTVDSIAFDAGFNDRKIFYRVFKKFTDLSPSQFRENMQKGK